MTKVRVNAFSISVDGFAAGPGQSLEEPMGRGGGGLHQWFRPTRTFHEMTGQEGGTTGVNNDFAVSSMQNLGAWVMGRNMFTPYHGPWTDNGWRGWWGDTPPYHCPVFVLTHHPREPLEMDGGTVFHFVTEGPEVALERARAAAGDRDIRIGGGASTVRQYLQAGQIDEMHLVVSPVLLGSGEPLLTGLDLPALGYEVSENAPADSALHLVVTRRP